MRVLIGYKLKTFWQWRCHSGAMLILDTGCASEALHLGAAPM